MGRRSRLSRSRDFDTVYRHGRSVSTRYVVLYSFRREDDAADQAELGQESRLGLAVPRKVGGAVERNRIKRRLRAAFDEVRAKADPTADYVLIVRPGLPETVDARGFPWLVEHLGELLERAGSSERGSRA